MEIHNNILMNTIKSTCLIGIACALIVSCSNKKLCKTNLVVPNATDSSFVSEAEKYLMKVPPSYFVKKNSDHLFMRFDYFINDSTKNVVEMKFPIIDSILIDSVYEINKISLWPFNVEGGRRTLNEKNHGSKIDVNEREWSRQLFVMYNSLAERFKLFESQGGEFIDFETRNGRSYKYFKNDINWDRVYCEYNPFKGEYNRHWIIEDHAQYNEFKINDKNDPWPINTVTTKDSTMIFYKVRETVVIKKPCNLIQAHEYLDDIFKKENIKVDSSFNGIEYHHGLGTWMRNNWELWSGNSHLFDYYIERGINHPDDMSGDILDSYGITRMMNHEDRKVYYDSIDVKECK